MDPRVAPLAEILRLNTKLFRSCLAGVTDEHAAMRPSEVTNNAAFIAAHVTEARFHLLDMMGAAHPSPIARYMEGVHGIDEMKSTPSMDEILRAWTTASHALRDRLDRITSAELDASVATPFRLPVSNPTPLSLLTFFVQHDSYHIGQLALLRKYAGLSAMQYQ